MCRCACADVEGKQPLQARSQGRLSFTCLPVLRQAHPHQLCREYALEAGLPFAIVPCCVFPRLFPHRRIPRTAGSNSHSGSNGTSGSSGGGGASSSGSSSSNSSDGSSEEAPVLSYRDLVAYLVARGRAQQAVLGFEGANIAVYRGAPAVPPAVPDAPHAPG